jgi:hypothetical protein
MEILEKGNAADRFALMNVAFGQNPYKTDEKLNIIDV